MKALKITAFVVVAIALIAAGAFAYWQIAVVSSPSLRLQRACEDAVLSQVYVPNSTHFILASVDPQPVARYLRMLKIDMEVGDVVDATKQFSQAKNLADARLGEIEVAFTSENRMGVPLRGLATCTYSAAPGKSIGERLVSVYVTRMDTGKGGPRLGHFAKFQYLWHAARKPVAQSAPPPAVPADAIRPTWSYTTVKVGGAQTPTVFGELQSANVIKLESPYDAPQTMDLGLWRASSYWFVSIRLDRGQFDCSDNCIVMAYIDGSLEIIHGHASNTGARASLDFGTDGNDFVSKLHTAKRARIVVPIFGNGYTSATFDVAGFDAAKFNQPEPIAKQR